VGLLFTVTFVVVVEEQPFEFVTVTVYTPDMAVVDEGLDGLCTPLVKDEGPLQEYPVPPPELSSIVSPAQ